MKIIRASSTGTILGNWNRNFRRPKRKKKSIALLPASQYAFVHVQVHSMFRTHVPLERVPAVKHLVAHVTHVVEASKALLPVSTKAGSVRVLLAAAIADKLLARNAGATTLRGCTWNVCLICCRGGRNFACCHCSVWCEGCQISNIFSSHVAELWKVEREMKRTLTKAWESMSKPTTLANLRDRQAEIKLTKDDDRGGRGAYKLYLWIVI